MKALPHPSLMGPPYKAFERVIAESLAPRLAPIYEENALMPLDIRPFDTARWYHPLFQWVLINSTI